MWGRSQDVLEKLKNEEFYHYDDQTHTLIDSFMGECPAEAVMDNGISPFDMPVEDTSDMAFSTHAAAETEYEPWTMTSTKWL